MQWNDRYPVHERSLSRPQVLEQAIGDIPAATPSVGLAHV